MQKMKSAKNSMKLFSGSANLSLSQKIANYLALPLGDIAISRYCDGEISVKYNENIRGVDLFIIQPTAPPSDHLIELLLMIDAARRASAKRITAVIPYFGYARQDRKDQPRVALSAKLMANLISTSGANRVLTMDLHSPSIQGFFDIPFDHLYSSPIFVEHIIKRKKETPVVVAPDIGSSKRARAYANRLNSELAVVDKKRLGPNKIETVTLIGEVKNRDVVLVDDIIDTAGTICRASELLKESGAKDVFAVCTHPILSNDAIEKIEKSALTEVIISDTIPIDKNKMSNKIKILTSANLFGEAIKRTHNEESISSLFN
jgi:ribose-phosphate pyrophosphokinase